MFQGRNTSVLKMVNVQHPGNEKAYDQNAGVDTPGKNIAHKAIYLPSDPAAQSNLLLLVSH